MRKNHMMIATLAMLSVVGSAQYARAQQTGTNQNAKEWGRPSENLIREASN